MSFQGSNTQYIPKEISFRQKRQGKPVKESSSTNLPTQTKSALINCTPCNQIRSKGGLGKYMNNRLYGMYSSSQNYYYIKDVNMILLGDRSSSTIHYNDLLQQIQHQEKENLKRLYSSLESRLKIEEFAEYYKFHSEIPRIFTGGEYDLYFEYHNRKRKCEFDRITAQLKLDNGEDPFIERRLERLRRRNARYSPVLKDLTPRKTQLSYSKDKSKTVEDIYHKLHDITNSSISANLSISFLRTIKNEPIQSNENNLNQAVSSDDDDYSCGVYLKKSSLTTKKNLMGKDQTKTKINHPWIHNENLKDKVMIKKLQPTLIGPKHTKLKAALEAYARSKKISHVDLKSSKLSKKENAQSPKVSRIKLI